MNLIRATEPSTSLTLPSQLELANQELADAEPRAITEWALKRSRKPVVSTNFRPGAAVMLHLITQLKPDIPVIWVDSGYNTPATYRHVALVRQRLNLNLHCFTPRLTSANYAAVHGKLPQPEDQDYAQFVQVAKLEPFERAFNELKPDVWFTGIRAEQSALRRSFGVVSRGLHNTLRVAPLHGSTDAQIRSYLERHRIPDNEDYIDPTKPGPKQECGLQLLA